MKVLYSFATLCLSTTLSCVDFMQVTMGVTGHVLSVCVPGVRVCMCVMGVYIDLTQSRSVFSDGLINNTMR